MHVFGIVFLFLAAVLPLSLWSITVSGIQTSAAIIAVVPVLIYWFLLDFALGAAILGAAVVLLAAAAAIVSHATAAGMWSLTAILIVVGAASQIIGHRVFEDASRRWSTIRRTCCSDQCLSWRSCLSDWAFGAISPSSSKGIRRMLHRDLK
ncbi:hypothetical protein ACFIOY_32555 [Bradyrhizobium sp. TZ2]